MCTDITHRTELTGSGYAAGEWIDLRKAVLSFDHPARLDVDHALCIDFRGENGDPSARVAVELDDASARRLAEDIIALLDSNEVRTSG